MRPWASPIDTIGLHLYNKEVSTGDPERSLLASRVTHQLDDFGQETPLTLSFPTSIRWGSAIYLTGLSLDQNEVARECESTTLCLVYDSINRC